VVADRPTPKLIKAGAKVVNYAVRLRCKWAPSGGVAPDFATSSPTVRSRYNPRPHEASTVSNATVNGEMGLDASLRCPVRRRNGSRSGFERVLCGPSAIAHCSSRPKQRS